MNAQCPTNTALADTVRHARHLLLDFDGPVCSLFAGTATAPVAGQLRDVLGACGIAMSPAIEETGDWFAIMSFAASAGPEAGARVEAELARLECDAVATARPGGDLTDVLAACEQSGRLVAVVSNNSIQAVRKYLIRHGLDRRIPVVVARTGPDVGQLKPSPHFIEAAAAGLAAAPADCAVVGDSPADMRAARAAGSAAIGYAPAPADRARLATAGAHAVVARLSDLAAGLRAARPGTRAS
jgi:beta-phosphoglucomutase-like phosphatase (HAD superfamily)